MSRFLLIFCMIFYLLIQNSAFATRNVVVTNPYYNPYYTVGNNYAPDFSLLEQHLFNKNFNGDNSINRLRRLEMNVFGAIQRGDFDTRYEKVKSAILSKSESSNYKKSILKNVTNYFTGQMTGFTPPITNTYTSDPYFEYQPSYSTSTTMERFSPWGRSYNTGNINRNSGMGIHIID